MNAERHTSSSEIIDRVAYINNSDLSDKVHPSRLYTLNKSALITEVPGRDEIGSNLVWLMQMDTILKAIISAGNITSDNSMLLPRFQYQHDVELADSSLNFYDDLRAFADDAEYYWCILRVWFTHLRSSYGWEKNLLSFKSDEEYKQEWGFHSMRFVNEIENLDDFDLAEWGLSLEYEYNPKTGEQYPTEVIIDDFDHFNSVYEFEPYQVDDVIKWFQGNLDEINHLYQHSVKLINQTAYDLFVKWKLTENTFEQSQDEARMSWPLTPKGNGYQFFSRGFRTSIFNEDFECFTSASSSRVRNMLTVAESMSRFLKDYTYYFDHLEATGSTAILTAGQVKKWQDWYRQRKEWHLTFMGLNKWWWSPEDNVTAEEMEPVFQRMLELQDKVKIKMDDLELLKADQAVLAKVGPKKKPADQADTIKKLLEAVEEYRPFLDKYGLVFRIEKKHDFDSPDPTALRFLEEIWTKPNRTNLALKRPKSDEPGQLANASKLEAKLRDYIGSPEWEAWYDVLNDGEGKCSRHAIGYQKVTKPGAKDSAYRNAGMRFVEANHLEPVANFDEVNLEKALTDQVRQQCKLKDIPDAWVNNIIRGFRWCRGDEELRDEFSLRLKDVGYEASDIDTFIKLAQSQVGKKITTKKTLYDARQVAGVFAYEQDKNPKLQPKELPKPKAPSKPKVVVL
jgi:hypothetical protein